jgi:hypothetical protein
MAVTSHLYPNAALKWAPGAVASPTNCINPTTDTFAAGLCTASAATWAATQWAYVFVSSVTAAYTEVTTGGGYTSGWANRQALTTFTYAVTGTANINMWTCTAPSPISFGATATISAACMFIYDKTAPTNPNTTDANSWVVWISDFGQTVVSTAGPFAYTVAATPNGLAYWTAS